MKRLHALDGLRGLAALSVVVWHWQHFYALTGTWAEGWDRAAQPFFWALKPLYEAGWAAVDLFFALSGFVFFWLYGAAIARREMGGGKFMLLRFSRLYPLHFATLIIVALLQFWFWRRTGHYFIFESGDWRRFVAALGMAQEWLPPTEEQFFDGPTWSVSIEVLLYIVFFWVCRARLTGPRVALAIAVGAVAIIPFNEFIARGLMGFFIGGAVWHGTEWIKRRPDAAKIARLLGWLALIAWGAALGEDTWGGLHRYADGMEGHVPSAIAQFFVGESDDLFLLPFIFIVSPLTIAALALQEQLLGRRYRALSFFGDISYSTYLLHFPMQLCLALAALHFGWAPAAFMAPWVMVAFFAALIALGALSHYGFERPMQKIMRGAVKRRALAETA